MVVLETAQSQVGPTIVKLQNALDQANAELWGYVENMEGGIKKRIWRALGHD